MRHVPIFMAVCVVAIVFGAPSSGAVTCLVGSIDVVTAPMDAIFTGTVAGVRNVGDPDPSRLCRDPRIAVLCQNRIATVTVGKVWKGQPGRTTTVFSHPFPGEIDIGHAFKVGEKMLFTVVRDAGDETEAEYLPAICGYTVPEEDARTAGLLDKLDTLLDSMGPAE